MLGITISGKDSVGASIYRKRCVFFFYFVIKTTNMDNLLEKKIAYLEQQDPALYFASPPADGECWAEDDIEQYIGTNYFLWKNMFTNKTKKIHLLLDKNEEEKLDADVTMHMFAFKHNLAPQLSPIVRPKNRNLIAFFDISNVMPLQNIQHFLKACELPNLFYNAGMHHGNLRLANIFVSEEDEDDLFCLDFRHARRETDIMFDFELLFSSIEEHFAYEEDKKTRLLKHLVDSIDKNNLKNLKELTTIMAYERKVKIMLNKKNKTI